MSFFVFIFSFLITACYRAVYKLHHSLCLRTGDPLQNSKLVIVGAYRTGGAGKTPFCIWLAEALVANRKRVAILCHEYAYDEAAMLRAHFAKVPEVEVFATRNRYRLAHELDKSQKFDIILCDDGFEDSRLTGATTIVLLWEKVPTSIRELWPLGYAKSLAKDHSGHTIEIHCGNPSEISFITDKIINKKGESLESLQNYGQTNVFCGLGDPNRFCASLQEMGVAITGKTFLRDHDRRFSYKLQKAMQKAPRSAFIISEKDEARLQTQDSAFERGDNLYTARQKTVVSENTAQRILNEFLNS